MKACRPNLQSNVARVKEGSPRQSMLARDIPNTQQPSIVRGEVLVTDQQARTTLVVGFMGANAEIDICIDLVLERLKFFKAPPKTSPLLRSESACSVTTEMDISRAT